MALNGRVTPCHGGCSLHTLTIQGWKLAREFTAYQQSVENCELRYITLHLIVHQAAEEYNRSLSSSCNIYENSNIGAVFVIARTSTQLLILYSSSACELHARGPAYSMVLSTRCPLATKL